MFKKAATAAEPRIVETEAALAGAAHDPLVIKNTQDITPEFIDSLRRDRDFTATTRAGEFHKAASIPTVIHEKWLREGYDCTREPIRKTLARLRAEGLDYFITTDKKL